MSIKPATVTLRIPQRATLRKRIRLSIDGTNVEVYAQVWDKTRTSLILDMTVEWIDRLDVVDGDPTCVFEIVATPLETELVQEDGIWDLKVVTTPDVDEDYWLRGPAIVDRGYTEDP